MAFARCIVLWLVACVVDAAENACVMMLQVFYGHASKWLTPFFQSDSQGETARAPHVMSSATASTRSIISHFDDNFLRVCIFSLSLFPPLPPSAAAILRDATFARACRTPWLRLEMMR
jgi:hypothetical protein